MCVEGGEGGGCPESPPTTHFSREGEGEFACSCATMLTWVRSGTFR